MVAWHSPWDLQFWFVNVLAGNMTLFLAMAFIVIAILAGMFRMPTIITGFFFGLFIIMLAVQTGNLFLLVVVVAAIIIGWSIARFFR